MDVLVYSNIQSCKSDIDYITALKALRRSNATVEHIRWACQFDTIHTGIMIADAFSLNKAILEKCPTYESICNDSNAVKEIIKIDILFRAFSDDIHSNLDILDIMQNNEQIALGYLQDDTFLRKVCSSKATIVELVKKQSYCNVVKTTINNHRSLIRSTLENSGASFTDIQVGSGSGTWNYEINKSNLLMAWQCYDDNDTDYSIYSGEGTHRVAYISRHSGLVNIDYVICLRGTKLVGSGSSVGYVKYRLYNLA